MKPFERPLCRQCGYAFSSESVPKENALCGACRRGLFIFDWARSHAGFEDPLKEIIHQFKYGSHRSLAKPLARLLFSVYLANIESLRAAIVVPVPLHRSRQRERGFNQARELARYFCRLAQIPLYSDLLQRARATQIQAGLSRRERRINLRGAFAVSKRDAVKDKSVLLIDDVFTTGATLNECARILKSEGATRINVLTLARVIRG